jgi:hypothetical protein
MCAMELCSEVRTGKLERRHVSSSSSLCRSNLRYSERIHEGWFEMSGRLLFPRGWTLTYQLVDVVRITWAMPFKVL